MSRVRKLASLLRRTPFHPQWLIASEREAMAGLLVKAKGTVLDIGCADRWAEQRLPAGCFYLGIDSISTGHGLYGARPTMFADAAGLPFLDASVDTVLLFEVLEHLPRPGPSLAEIRRVLRADGVLLASVPFLYPIHDAPHDYQRYTLHGLEQVLAQSGMEMKHCEPRLDAVSSAALLANLALGGSAKVALQEPGPRVLLVPLMLLAIPVINLCAIMLRPFASRWDAMTNGYIVIAGPP